MRRSGASDELLGTLGGIDLPSVWSAVKAWWRTPVIDVAPEGDEQSVRVSRVGDPPLVLALRSLIRLEFSRAFTLDGRFALDGSGGVTLWFAEWDAPEIDATGRGPGALIESVERAPWFAVACAQPVLARVFVDESARRREVLAPDVTCVGRLADELRGGSLHGIEFALGLVIDERLGNVERNDGLVLQWQRAPLVFEGVMHTLLPDGPNRLVAEFTLEPGAVSRVWLGDECIELVLVP